MSGSSLLSGFFGALAGGTISGTASIGLYVIQRRDKEKGDQRSQEMTTARATIKAVNDIRALPFEPETGPPGSTQQNLHNSWNAKRNELLAALDSAAIEIPNVEARRRIKQVADNMRYDIGPASILGRTEGEVRYTSCEHALEILESILHRTQLPPIDHQVAIDSGAVGDYWDAISD
jgi:hypothetical protein